MLIGSQNREKLEDTDYKLAGRLNLGEETAQQVILDDSGKKELWIENDSHSGYTIEINGVGYEFVRTATIGDLWWAGLN